MSHCSSVTVQLQTAVSTPRRRKQENPRAFKQLQHESEYSSSDENATDTMENETVCITALSPASSASSSNSEPMIASLSSPQRDPPLETQLYLSKDDHHLSHLENGEDIIMFSNDQLEGMGTPCSPSETTVSSETTSTSSVDEMQMSYTIGVTEGTPYPCTFCDKAFPRLSYLKRHEQIHSDQMPFRCDYCQRLFKHKRSRDRHVKLHTGDKRYRCCHCESAFSRSDHLKIHMKTHDHMKPFQCAICNRGYNTAAALTSHMQNHKRNNTITNNSNNNNNSSGTSIAIKNIPNNNANNSSGNNGNVNLDTSAVSRQESRCNSPTNKVSDMINNRLSPNGSAFQSHHAQDQPQQQLTCGFCGVKCTSLESHIRQAHLHHLLFAGLLQNSFCHPAAAAVSNWQALMPPPPLPALTPANDLLQLHSSLPNGSSSPPSPKKAKMGKCPTSAPTSPHQSSVPQSPLNSLPLLCNQCSPSPAFPDFESFRIHLKSHLIASQHHASHQIHHQSACPYCGESITSDFETHVMSCHMGTVTTQYGCECCNKMFAKPDELQKHLMDIHAHHLYQCSLCRDMFDSKVSIQVHFAVKHSNECKIFKCNICGEFWNNEHDFKLHVKLVHLQPSHLTPQTQLGAAFPLFCTKAFFRCKYCSEEFNIEYLLERHLESEHSLQHQTQLKLQKGNNSDRIKSPTVTIGKHQKNSKEHLKCDLCLNNNFKSIAELECHLKIQHKGNSNSINNGQNNKMNNKCNICDELFGSISELAEHKLKKHCMFGASQCLQCHSKITNRDEYMKHFVEHNNLNNTDNVLSNTLFPVHCIVCKQTLMSDVEIDLHSRYHCEHENTKESSSSPNSNAETESEINSPSLSPPKLVEHSNSDTTTIAPRELSVNSPDNNGITNKRYQCIKCQESFTNEQEIKEHVHRHIINEGTIECKLCDKEFDTPAKLQCHLIEHNFNGGNEYKCHLCDIIFDSSQQLQGHMFEEHPNDRPYDCGRCLQKFWFPTELDNHTMVEHNNDDEDEELDIECDNSDDEPKEEHQNHIEKDGTFVCRDCGKRFHGERHLNHHLKTSHHRSKHQHNNQSLICDKRYACGVCGKRFSQKKNRKLHYESLHC